MKLRTAAVALVLGALLGAGGTLGVRALMGGHGYSGPPAGQLSESWLQGVDINGLADEGLYLSQPPRDYHPQISGGYAKQVADRNGFFSSNVSARQILLAHLQTEWVGGFDGQVFIINYDPTEIPAECPGAHTVYAIVFVDADTGKYLSGEHVESAGTPSPSCHHGVPFGTPAATATPLPMP